MASDTEHVGEIYAVNVPRRQNWDKLSLDEVKEIVSKYRRIYANASCKDLYETKDEATKLSNAVGRPLGVVNLLGVEGASRISPSSTPFSVLDRRVRRDSSCTASSCS